MSRYSRTRADAPPVTGSGLLLGARLTWPMWPGVAIFSSALGALAAQKGFSLTELLVLHGAVYAGLSESVALSLWQDRWTLSAVAGVALVTMIVNMRMTLMGAALRPHLEGHPAPLTYAHLSLLTDANYLRFMLYAGQGGRDVGVLIGAGLALWLLWVLAGIPGYYLGALIADPKRYGLDLVVPIYFVGLAVPMWRGSRDTRVMLAAATAALAANLAFGGYVHIVLGALAGMLVGALRGDD